MPLDSLVAPVSGVTLVVLGLAFLRRHRRTWRARRDDPAIEPDEKSYYRRQHRRRMFTSGLLVLLGVLIPIGDLLFARKPAPPALPLTIYWIGVLSIVLLVLLMGLVDLFATGIHAKDAMSRVRSERAALERQLEEIRRSLGRDRT